VIKARNHFWPTAARTRRTCGFTLIELMMTMTVAAIMMAFAIPSMRTFLQNQRIASSATTLMYALSYARSEAVKENNPTTSGVGGIEVCPSLDGATCDNAGNWSDGWIVLSPNPNIAGPLLVLGSLPPGVTVTQNAALPAIIFQGNGMLPSGQVAALAVPYVQFKICDTRVNPPTGTAPLYARDVELNATGHVQSAPQIGEDVAGNPLSCP
jgi:prepilin-type N-terminal cleavage/methylation domain-containing protein